MHIVTSKVAKGWQTRRGCDGVIEAVEVQGMPKHVMVARTLGCVGWNGEVPLQIMNVGPGPITLFKGTKVGYFTPREQILVIKKQVKESVELSMPQCSAVDLSRL